MKIVIKDLYAYILQQTQVVQINTELEFDLVDIGTVSIGHSGAKDWDSACLEPTGASKLHIISVCYIC